MPRRDGGCVYRDVEFGVYGFLVLVLDDEDRRISADEISYSIIASRQVLKVLFARACVYHIFFHDTLLRSSSTMQGGCFGMITQPS